MSTQRRQPASTTHTGEGATPAPMQPAARPRPALFAERRARERLPVVPPHALLVFTRDPTGQLSGRKTVLATIANSLEALGYTVEVGVATRRPPIDMWFGRPLHHLPLPSLPRVAVSAIRSLLTGRGSLNEALFNSPAARRSVAALTADGRTTVVVADTLRVIGIAGAAGAPVVVHLDDLLSDRYREASSTAGPRGNLLGFFGRQIPSYLHSAVTAVAGRLLRTEADLMQRREIEVARSAAAVAITSPAEAAELARRTGVRVAALPMAIDVREPADVAACPATSMVFLGHMDYEPNMAAVRWWRNEVRPELDRLGGADVVLTIIGCASTEQRAELADARVQFAGYVEDLGAELRRHRGLLAPITRGTGLKTKVLDGLSVGLPIVGTDLAFAGLDIRDGENGLVGLDAASFAARVLQLRDEPALAARVGLAGRDLLAATWSSGALVQGWSRLLAQLPDTTSEHDRSTAREDGAAAAATSATTVAAAPTTSAATSAAEQHRAAS